MELTIGDKVFYARLTGLRVPRKVVGHSDEGYVGLEYHQDCVRVVNHRCPIDSISFGIPSLDPPPPSPEVPPDVLSDEGDGSPRRGRPPLIPTMEVPPYFLSEEGDGSPLRRVECSL
jgi:hypothetical protein